MGRVINRYRARWLSRCAAAALLASVVAAGCAWPPNENFGRDYKVWNHSLNEYSVRLDTQSGDTHWLGVPAYGYVAGGFAGEEPVSATLFNLGCTNKVASLTFVSGVLDIVIDANGDAAVATALVDQVKASLPRANYLEVPMARLQVYTSTPIAH